MPQLLGELGFQANSRTRRAPCLLHGGSNVTAFSWRDDGLWHCFSCGAGGDKIALVRAVRRCDFRAAVGFLAQLAGVEYQHDKLSRTDLYDERERRERAERAAWLIYDRVAAIRSHSAQALRYCERSRAQIGEQMKCSCDAVELESGWNALARLASEATFFLASLDFCDGDTETRIRFALASPAERRAFIFGECHAE